MSTKNIYCQKKTKLKAVDDVCFGIPVNECFGLLGPNGAGKTTLFSILCGLEKSDSGDCVINGFSVNSQIDKVYSSIGLCPQFDVLYDNMTAGEHIKLIAKLRGIPNDKIPQIVKEHIEKFDLEDNKLVKTFSGGNKRKLSVCLSFISNPQVCFLDEPTTGMDPLMRRKIWEIIKENKAGRAVILTTHSMEEADAICDRIGILVAGEMRCMGTSQHLKAKYGSGYRVSIRTTPEMENQVREFMEDIYPSLKILSQLNGTLHLDIPLREEDMPEFLANIFEQIESNKSDLNISDYSVSQTTLEQVFLKFAEEQREVESL